MITIASMSTDRFFALLPFLLPLLLVDLGLIVYALIDLSKSERRVRGSKVVWALIILIFGTLGPLAYLFFGRKDM